MKVTRKDLLTPANAITLAGFCLSGYGILHLTSLTGTLLFGTGRWFDMADGIVARRTHTSNFGAMFDASVDKFISLFVLIACWHYHIVPLGILLFILIQNSMNVLSYFVATHMDEGPKPLKAGKISISMQMFTIMFFCLAQFGMQHLWRSLGWIEFTLHVPIALYATGRYVHYAVYGRRPAKANTTTDKKKP